MIPTLRSLVLLAGLLVNPANAQEGGPVTSLSQTSTQSVKSWATVASTTYSPPKETVIYSGYSSDGATWSVPVTVPVTEKASVTCSQGLCHTVTAQPTRTNPDSRTWTMIYTNGGVWSLALTPTPTTTYRWTTWVTAGQTFIGTVAPSASPASTSAAANLRSRNIGNIVIPVVFSLLGAALALILFLLRARIRARRRTMQSKPAAWVRRPGSWATDTKTQTQPGLNHIPLMESPPTATTNPFSFALPPDAYADHTHDQYGQHRRSGSGGSVGELPSPTSPFTPTPRPPRSRTHDRKRSLI